MSLINFLGWALTQSETNLNEIDPAFTNPPEGSVTVSFNLKLRDNDIDGIVFKNWIMPEYIVDNAVYLNAISYHDADQGDLFDIAVQDLVEDYNRDEHDPDKFIIYFSPHIPPQHLAFHAFLVIQVVLSGDLNYDNGDFEHRTALDFARRLIFQENLLEGYRHAFPIESDQNQFIAWFESPAGQNALLQACEIFVPGV